MNSIKSIENFHLIIHNHIHIFLLILSDIDKINYNIDKIDLINTI